MEKLDCVHGGSIERARTSSVLRDSPLATSHILGADDSRIFTQFS